MLDHLIILVYLSIVLYMGYASRKLGSFREFAVSHGNYGWLAIFCTLSASFIGGGFSTGNAAKVFSSGLAYPLALMGFSLQIMLVACFVAPRMHRFPGAISVGDLMEPAYGRRARVITGIFSMLICAGILGAQIGAMGAIFKVFLGIPPLLGILIGAGIVFFYSTLGGMAAVVRTDILQFWLIILGIPLVFIFGVAEVGGWAAFVAGIPASHLEIIGEQRSLLSFLSLFLVFMFGETLVPPYLQRLLLGRSASDTAKGNFWSAVVSVPFFLIAGAIGLVALQLDPGLQANLALPEVVRRVMPVGLAGLIIAGVLSIVMSSADSFLNASSVALVQDVTRPLRRTPLDERQALNIARLGNLLTGVLALLFALLIPNVLDILVAAYDYWAPSILVPLMAVLMGWRTTPAAFYAAVAAGVGGTLVWQYVLQSPGQIQGFVVGTLLNLVVFTLATRFGALPATQPARSGGE